MVKKKKKKLRAPRLIVTSEGAVFGEIKGKRLRAGMLSPRARATLKFLKEEREGNPFTCPSGTSKQFRFKGKVRLGGCAKKGKFIKGGVVEVTSFRKKNGTRVKRHRRRKPRRK